MSLDGNGTYSPPAPQFPAIPNTIIYADDFNQIILDIAAALSTAIFRDGQAAFTADQSLGNHKLTNVKAGTNPQDAVNFLQVFTDPVFVATTLQGFKISGSMFQALMTTITLVASGTLTLTGTTLLDASASGEVRLPATTSIGTISASELATLDGLTASTAELNVLDGITASTAELNVLDGITVSTAELNSVVDRAPKNSPTFTGVPTAPTAATGTSTTQLATCAFVVDTAFNAALPGQTGNAGKFVTTDGVNAYWATVRLVGAGGAAATGSVVLTSSSGAMQLITSTALGQSVTLPDATTLSEGIPIFNIKNVGPYEMLLLDGAGNRVGVIGAGGYAICSLFDNSNAAGTWQISGIQYSAVFETFNLSIARNTDQPIQYLEIDTGKHLFVFVESATNRIYGVIYDETTNTSGAATLIRALPGTPGPQPVGIARISATQALIVSCAGANNSTAAEAVVLSISGTTITVNSPTSYTLSANAARTGSPVQIGSSFVVPYTRYGSPWQQAYRAMTVSGTTVTIGLEVVHSSTADNTNFTPTIIPLSSTTFFGIGCDQGTAIQCLVGTVSGSSLSVGSTSNLNAADSVPVYYSRLLSTGRVAILYKDGTSVLGAIMSISGTNVSQSVITLGNGTSGAAFTAVNIGDVFIAAWGSSSANNNSVRVLKDSSGSATAGTLNTFGNSVANGIEYVGHTATELFFMVENTTTSATLYRSYISAGDVVFEEIGRVAGAGVSFIGGVTNARTTENERATTMLVGQAAMGSPQGGELAMLIGGRAKPVYNEPSGFSSTFEQTSLNKGWFVIDGTTTTFRRMEMI